MIIGETRSKREMTLEQTSRIGLELITGSKFGSEPGLTLGVELEIITITRKIKSLTTTPVPKSTWSSMFLLS